MSIPEIKLQTSSTVQLEMSSCSFGLSLPALFGIAMLALGLLADGVFTLGRFVGGAAADKSNGEDVSCLLTFLSRLWISASFAVRTMAISVCVVDMSIIGGNIEAPMNGFREARSGFFVSEFLDDGGVRVGSRGKAAGLNRGSKGGGNPFLAALK